jgi:hypothetical protein
MHAGGAPPENPPLSVPLASAKLPEITSRWVLEDFEESSQKGQDFDPWEPLCVFQVISPPASEHRSSEIPLWEDFWDPASPSSFDIEVSATDWQEDLYLPAFVPHAAENPFRLVLRAPSSEDKAIQRARWLVSLLDIPQLERRRVFERRFSELFSVYPHAATFSALADLALEGAAADDLWCAFELKETPRLRKQNWMPQETERNWRWPKPSLSSVIQMT